MSASSLDDLGKLLLRLVLGLLLLFHGLDKLSGGVGAVAGLLNYHGLPPFLAWGVFVGELLAPLFLLLGLYTRLGGVLIALHMATALYLAHSAQWGQLNAQGGWAIELQVMYLVGGVAVALLGAGRYSAGGSHGALN